QTAPPDRSGKDPAWCASVIGSLARSATGIGVPVRQRRLRMADDKSNVGAQDRSRVAAGQQYEVAYFAEKHGLTMDDARAIIEQAGPSREKADELAERRGWGAKLPSCP